RGEVALLSDPAARAYGGDAVAAARAYLADLAPLIGPAPGGRPEVTEVAGRVLVRFPEEVGGVPVLGRGLSVALAPGGRPTLVVRSTAAGAAGVDRTDLVGEEEARAVARRAVGHSARSLSRERLVILPLAGALVLAHQVTTHEGYSTYEVFVGAK